MAVDRMPWFKWWDGTAADMKFRMVAEECKLPVACIVGAWAYMLEHASRSADRGSIADIDMEVMAYTLGLPDCETVCNAMKRRKLLHDDGTIAKWEDRQAKREKTEPSGSSTDRVRRFREKQKQNQNSGLPEDDAGGNGNNDETDETAGNGTKRPKRKNRVEEDKEPKTLTPSSADAPDELDEKVKPFDQFWTAYPHKVGKQDALKAWTKIKPDAELLAAILAAIEAQQAGAAWMRDDGQYIPHPATWLRAGRWLDEVRAYVAPAPKLPNGWWESAESMKAAGAMLTPPLVPEKGEGQKAFAHRIRVAIGQADPLPASASAAPPIAAQIPYLPPAPPPGVELTPEQVDARRSEFRETLAKLKQAAGEANAGIQAAVAA